MRLSLVLVAAHPLVYHKMVEALFCGDRGGAASFDQSVCKFKPVLYNHSHGTPAGMFARALVLQLRDLWNLAGFHTDFRPMIPLHDTTFHREVRIDTVLRSEPPTLVFTMDVPTMFAE